MAKKKDDRCWPGYEPVKGKKPHSQGSCRPEAESKLTRSEKEFRKKRGQQLEEWQKEHPGTRRSAAQHLRAPAAKKKSTASKPAKPPTGGRKKLGGSRKQVKRKR